MSVESFDPATVATGETVTVTDAAVEHFRRQLAADSKARAVHLSVKESGCTGFMYVVDLVADSAPDDLRMPLADDVELLIARDSLPIVKGTRIDFVREGVNRQLRFINPNAKDHCGCGESFNVNS